MYGVLKQQATGKSRNHGPPYELSGSAACLNESNSLVKDFGR